jgi:hypothetical protein
MSALASEARLETTVPRRYLSQLCKHFQHKLDVTLEERSGRIAFSAGVCELQAGTDLLILRAQADTAEQLHTVEDVITRHLQRFAFREPLELNWAPSP